MAMSRGANVFVLPVIRGLVGEAAEVKRAVEEITPNAIGVCVSKEELRTLERMGDEEAEPSSAHEEAYVAGLERFGEVRKPPPCYTEALAQAKRLKVPCVAIDMDEALFTDAYCNFVSTVDVMKQTRDARIIKKKGFEANSPDDFVMQYDAYVNRHRGLERLERERERYIALRLSKMSAKWDRVLGIVEVERAQGVLEQLELHFPL